MKPASLVATCQLFLIPASILFAALGASSTEQLKTLISVMGLLTSALWLYRILLWKRLAAIDRFTVVTLAGIFTVAWFIALVVHARNWYGA